VLGGFLERPLDSGQARQCGLLLARAGTSDIADAAVTLLAHDGDTILTSDPVDIQRLLDANRTKARVRSVEAPQSTSASSRAYASSTARVAAV
jgi:hypothetical protein